MIKSKIANKQDLQSWGIVFLMIALAVFFRALILGSAFPFPLEMFIFYPTIIICALLVVKLFIDRTSHVVFRSKFIEILLMSLGFGFLISLVPVWSKEAAVMPLSLTQIGTYLMTLGAYPVDAGPDGLLRGVAWSLAIIVAIAIYRDTKEFFRPLAMAAVAWFVMTVVFLLPSIIVIITMVINSLSVSLPGADMVKQFTRMSLFSYWNEGQLLRWFTGFGEQAANSLLLYTASWVFILGAAAWFAGNIKKLRDVWQGFGWDWFFSAAAVIYIGYVAGMSGARWVGMDAAVWLVLLALLGLGWMMYMLGTDAGEGSVLLLWLLGSALLGWPVFAGGLAFVFLVKLREALQSRPSRGKFEWLLSGVAAGALMLLIVLFMRRGQLVELPMLRIVGAGLVFALMASFAKYAVRQGINKVAVITAWLTACVLIWIVTGVFAGTALMMLVGVLLWFFWHRLMRVAWLPPALAWILAVVVMLLIVHLPRLAHPELVPR
ncbi:hypothetical protein GF391_02070 [Candidatus Uhrbacteria bacterium]|nr:hypothetical protein [Candidatus Uhrbacteria bacterium]